MNTAHIMNNAITVQIHTVTSKLCTRLNEISAKLYSSNPNDMLLCYILAAINTQDLN